MQEDIYSAKTMNDSDIKFTDNDRGAFSLTSWRRSLPAILFTARTSDRFEIAFQIQLEFHKNSKDDNLSLKCPMYFDWAPCEWIFYQQKSSIIVRTTYNDRNIIHNM